MLRAMTNHRILLADDDVELAQLLRDFLTRDGFDVVLAHDAEGALAAARAHAFDALVLDCADRDPGPSDPPLPPGTTAFRARPSMPPQYSSLFRNSSQLTPSSISYTPGRLMLPPALMSLVPVLLPTPILA